MLKAKLRLPEDRIAAVDAVAAFPVTPKPEHPPPIEIRGLIDRWILATAVAGGADVLVTGGQDLLAAQSDAPIPILGPRAFWDLLRAGHAG